MSPVVLPPVSTAYCSLSRAPPPPSVKNQPGIVRLLVVEPAVLESVSKFWVEADPSVVRLMHGPFADATGTNTDREPTSRATRTTASDLSRLRRLRRTTWSGALESITVSASECADSDYEVRRIATSRRGSSSATSSSLSPAGQRP